MKLKLRGLFAAILTLALMPSAFAQVKGDATAEMKTLFEKVKADLQAGKKTEKEQADNLKQFDALLEEHKGEKTDEVANILFMKALLYLQVFDNTAKGKELVEQLKRDFPTTKPGQGADKMLASIKKQEESQKIKANLTAGMTFPDFNEKDLDGKTLSIANLKGKVVLLDFWATWCGPCVQELPNVQKIYEKNHGNGFEIIGISLDSDKSKLASFIKDKNIPWQQYFDGLKWENKLAAKYGVESIPATYLLDREGKIIAEGLRGEELDAAVTKALASK